MWIRQILLAIIGASAGIAVAGGVFAFIVELGVIEAFADRTHTAEHILLYEDSTALGAIAGTICLILRLSLPCGKCFVALFGILIGIFVGCWSMALAEILNVFPIFIRRTKITKFLPVFIASMAVGRSVGALYFFIQGW